jgi:hypothetical protein
MRHNIYRLIVLSFSLLLFTVSFPVSAQPTTRQVPGTYATIALAIAAASDGDTIQIAAGTYTGNFTLNKRLTIQGAGSGDDPLTSTIINGTITIQSGASGATLTNFRVTGSGNGINIGQPISNLGLTLDNVSVVGNSSYGINVNNTTVNNLTIRNSTISSNTSVGLRFASTASAYNLLIENSLFEGNVRGFYAESNGSTVIDGVQIINTTFHNNSEKGIYLEKLSNAVFDGIVMTDNGNLPSEPKNAGLDINLKYQTYSNIEIKNSTFTGNGEGGSAVVIKSRADSTPQAVLNGVTLENVEIYDNPGRGLMIGNNPLDNMTGVTITSSQIYDNENGVVNFVNDVTVTNNWWGCNDPNDPNSGCDPIAGVNIDPDDQVTLNPTISPVSGAECVLTLTFQDSSDATVDLYSGKTVSFSTSNGTVTPTGTITGGSVAVNFDTVYTGYPTTITATVNSIPFDYPVTCGTPATDPVYNSTPAIGSLIAIDGANPAGTIVVENATYGADLVLSSIVVDNPAFTVDTPNATVLSLDDTPIGITCSGLQTGTLSIYHNDPAQPNPATYALSCDIADTTALYGSVPAVGSAINLDPDTPSINMEVSNLAYGIDLEVTLIEVDAPLDFSYNQTNFTLGSLASTNFDLSCDAVEPGTYTTTLSIHHNGSNVASPATYPVTCIIPEPAPSDPLTIVELVDADGNALQDQVYVDSVAGISIRFNMPVLVDGTANPDSALNPANYILLEGPTYATGICADGVSPQDTQINPANITYDNATNTVFLNFAPPLGLGEYRLILCGTTSIVSANDPSVSLNNATDVVVNFTVAGIQATATPPPSGTPTAIPTEQPQPAPVVPTPAQPEDLGVIALPDTGETPLWAELLGRWLGR